MADAGADDAIARIHQHIEQLLEAVVRQESRCIHPAASPLGLLGRKATCLSIRSPRQPGAFPKRSENQPARDRRLSKRSRLLAKAWRSRSP